MRPDHYSAIDNFYTATVYDKGAELVRMIAGRLGAQGWRRGMDEYFRRHDGEAATVEQFLAALGEANGTDLAPYLLWYEQAGTPQLHGRGEFDAATRSYTLTLRQYTAPSSAQPQKLPLPIPVRVSLFHPAGHALPLRLVGEDAGSATERMLEVDRDVQRFRFVDIEAAPVASLLRGFSAPVVLDAGYTPDDLAFFLRHESDGYNRWEAAQQLARLAFNEVLAARTGMACQTWLAALHTLFSDTSLDPALLAELLTPPDALELAELAVPFDPAAVHAAREALEDALAARLGPALGERYSALIAQEQGGLDGAAQARRRLANRCLSLWARVDARAHEIAAQRCDRAPSMTERLAALTTLTRHVDAQAELAQFEQRYRHDANTLDKWFALQASIPRVDTVERVSALLRHPQFSLTNPNCAFALLRSFAARNLVAFHRADGAGYALMTAAIGELDGLNPQIAARMATTLKDWQRLEPRRRGLLRGQLEALARRPHLSGDLTDILSRALAH